VSLNSAVQTNYQKVNGREAVDVTAGDTTVEDVQAKRRVLGFADLAFAGALGLNAETIVWNLFTATLDGAEPKPGDTITDSDDVVWKIAAVNKMAWGSRFRCICTKGRA
jgi:hypothetical protein